METGTQTSVDDYDGGHVAVSLPQTCLFETRSGDTSELPPPILQTEPFYRVSAVLPQTNLAPSCPSTNDGSDLPSSVATHRWTPNTLYGQPWDLGKEKSNASNLVCDLDKEMQYEAEQVRALEKCKDRPTQHDVPLDFNLRCPMCAKVFRKGQIQRFREHVSNCAVNTS